ncbi:MAG: DNA-binding response regulator [Owenweeksia sp.]|nr:DNA-binding response regulator [Owenweeksia sp.]MBF99286.1 DNA-binding response regulator [Owenweeksia sp.]HBF18635.1 DNA-binding response regulator [Cryomorphaceae bacterium]HCQ16216.1 DNA-binding response regulator [Cryomorphaceae bacterium]|tara:strand:- start:582 stop:1235 length:654 start_codon:yes stop_codon:yes gene_type:complete
MNQPIRIALVDDHRIVRSGLASILRSDNRFLVVQEAANGRELIDGMDISHPHVVLLDLEMPVLSGREALTEIRAKENDVRVLILTMHQNKAFISQMMELGANGYLVKDSEPEEVVKAIEKVHAVGFYFSDLVSMAMLHKISAPQMKAPILPEHGLTNRELDVLQLICQEKTTTEIGELLFLSPKTIEGYRKVLMEKVRARNMAGLVLFAVRHGLIKA